LIPDCPPYNPFLGVINDIAAYTEISPPSINFSEDNNGIHVAYNGTIKTYKLNENQLTLVSQSTYTSAGLVGRDGKIVEPKDIYGRKDPLDWSDGSVQVFQSNGRWHLYNIAVGRRGPFKCLWDCVVTSENGYYSYKYNYLVGEFTVTGAPGTAATVLIDWNDPERPNDVYFHMKTTYSGMEPGIQISGLSW
jgi:hypothetical protein